MTKSLYDPLVEERGKLQGKIERNMEVLLSVVTVVVGNILDDLISRIRNN